MTRKNCTACKKSKLFAEFDKNLRSKDGRHTYCKVCRKISADKLMYTRDGLIFLLYSGQKARSKRRNHKPPSYTEADLSIWIKNQRNFEGLYLNWVESGFDRWEKPSVDRRDDYQPYTISNLLRICTWRENSLRGHADAKNGINNKRNRPLNQFTLDGEFIKEHYSINSAGRKAQTSCGNIHSCCTGKRKSAGGFKWEYTNCYGY